MFGLWRLRLLAAVVIVCAQFLSVSVLPRVQGVQAQEAALTPQYAPNRFIVRLKGPQEGVFTSAASVAAAYDAKPGVDVDQVYNNVFNGFAGEFTTTAAAALAKDPRVQDVFPDRASKLVSLDNVPGIDRVDADLNPTKAGNGTGSVSVDVAVIDSGVYNHSDLNVYRAKDCTISRASDAYHDYIGHGTHVAGTIGAKDNGVGVVGVAPGARIWAVKVFSDGQPAGEEVTYDSETMCGLDYVAANASSIEVVNLSIGGYLGYDLGSCSAHVYHQAFCNVVNKGVTVVVAAGNSNDDARYYVPAQFNEVITVSAYFDNDGKAGALGGCSYAADGWFGCDDDRASFSNYGADVDIAAPGMGVYSTFSAYAPSYYCESSQYCTMSGTSMASPHVAGGAALIRAQQGTMSPSSVKARLQMTGQPGGIGNDPDGIDESVMNVAYLGKGKIVAPSSAKVGDTIQVRVGDYTPTTRAIFRFNGTYIGGDTIDDYGRGHRNYTIPAMPKGTYKVTVSNGLKTVTKNVTIDSSITLSPTSGPVGETVTVTLRGFAKGELVDVNFGSRRVYTDKLMSSTGSGSLSFTVPATPGGTYTVTATGNQGNKTTASFSLKQSAYVSSGTPAPGANVTVQYRGFKAGETITMRYGTQDGEVVNTAPETASSTGSGSDTATIPATAVNGTGYLWVMGDLGTKIRITLSVSGAGLPTPEPTATAEPTETPAPTEEPTEVPTEEPTEIPTEEPTEVPTEAPTDVPTETATEVPTEEPTAVPTETPTVEA